MPFIAPRRIYGERQEREDLAADPRQGEQPVMMAGQASPLVREDRLELIGAQCLHGSGGQDHRRVPAATQ